MNWRMAALKQLKAYALRRGLVDGRVWDVMVRSGDVWWTQVLSGWRGKADGRIR